MRSDPTAAEWGLFQVSYAFLVQELAAAVFYLRRRREPKIQFGQVFKKSPDQLLGALELELGQIDRESYREIPELRESVCPEIKKLKEWRDPRIHARVDLEHGISLYDWKTRRRLEMTAPECREKSDLALSLALRIRGLVHFLLTDLEADETLVSELAILLDSPDAQSTTV